MNKYAIGIDLGTTYSCVGVVKDGAVKIIHNDCGFTTTPSCVAFTEDERLIGDPAKSQGIRNYQNTVFAVKRLIGRNFDEKSVQDDINYLPFKVTKVNRRCGILVHFKGKRMTFTPEELSAMVLTKMKETAEAFLRQEVKEAVITVPAYFNNSQRQATKDAAAIAGLNVLRIINEPTAAGIAYALDEKTPKQQTILIYDLGGGTFDVTVMTIENEKFTVRSTSGDTHLGGEDFSTCLVNYCATTFKQKHKIDITTNLRALRKLQKACEEAKKILSHKAQTTIEVDSITDGIDFTLDITRSRFEELCVHLFKKTLKSVEDALLGAEISKDQIDEIILVGGSTRIPRVQRLLADYFNGKRLNNTVHPDEAVAYGAAIQAAILAGNKTHLVRNVRIQDVTPMSLGIEINEEDAFSAVVKKNTPLPAKRTECYQTSCDYQENGTVAVYEGENAICVDNNLLGSFVLQEHRRAPKGEVEVDVVFEVDENGILDVQATERGTNNSGNIRIDRSTGGLSKEDLARMIENEASYVAEDRALKLLTDGVRNM